MMKSVINGKLYNTATATVLASNCRWNGSDWSAEGRNTFLYRTPEGDYFSFHTSRWERERNHIRALPEWEARYLYENLSVRLAEMPDAKEATCLTSR